VGLFFPGNVGWGEGVVGVGGFFGWAVVLLWSGSEGGGRFCGVGGGGCCGVRDDVCLGRGCLVEGGRWQGSM